MLKEWNLNLDERQEKDHRYIFSEVLQQMAVEEVFGLAIVGWEALWEKEKRREIVPPDSSGPEREVSHGRVDGEPWAPGRVAEPEKEKSLTKEERKELEKLRAEEDVLWVAFWRAAAALAKHDHATVEEILGCALAGIPAEVAAEVEARLKEDAELAASLGS